MKTRLLTTADGIDLFVRNWDLPPLEESRGSILIIHGLGGHSNRFSGLAKMFNNLGFDVRSYDHRGFGKSSGKRGVIPNKDSLLNDAKQVFEDFAKDRSQVPFLLGNNLGGTVAATLAARKLINPSGVILTSPIFKLDLSAFQKAELILGRAFFPELTIAHEYPAEYLSKSRKIVGDFRTDPLNHNQVSPRIVKFMMDAGNESISSAHDLKVPTLVLVARNDPIISIEGSEMFYKNAPKDLVQMNIYESQYHEIFSGPDGETVCVDIGNWVEKQFET